MAATRLVTAALHCHGAVKTGGNFGRVSWQIFGQSKLIKVQGRVLSKVNKLKFNIEETSFFSQLT